MKINKNFYKKIIITAFAVTFPVIWACSPRKSDTENSQETTASYENTTPDADAGFLPSDVYIEDITASEGNLSDTSDVNSETAKAVLSEAESNMSPSEAETKIPSSETEVETEIPSSEAETQAPQTYTASDYTGIVTFNGASVASSGKNISINDTVVTITAGGTYYISGKLSEGQLIVDASDDKKVTLIFDNVEINNSTASCVYVKNTKKLYLILQDGSSNLLSCTAALDDESSETDAAFYSKEDIILQGDGSLTVTSEYNGITSKDSLEIYGGNYYITAGNNGIKGKDSVYIEAGNIVITSQNDGIKSTNTEDEALGYIKIAGGSINITSSGDGISAETGIEISDGIITIVSGGGSANASTASGQMQNFNRFFWQTDTNTRTTDETSCKGIKAGISIIINGGTINIDSADDAIHSNDNMTINGGVFTIQTGDDGMHSDTLLTINAGTVNITKSYEGIEASDIVFNGGYIYIVASDDGINAAGGNDNSQANGMWGGDNFRMNGNSSNSITINAGYIFVNAAGDGLDSNGNIIMQGGTVIVNGPTDSGNAALDFDGTFSYNGGSIIASGSSGMLQTLTASASTVNSICITFNSTITANSVIKIEDPDGNEVLAYASEKAYNSLIVGSSLFEEGKTYKIYINGTYADGAEVNGVYTGGTYTGTEYSAITIAGTVTTSGSGGGMNTGGMGGNVRPGGSTFHGGR